MKTKPMRLRSYFYNGREGGGEMKETIYWWIEKSNGNLAQNAREIINSEIWEGGAPKLFFWRRDAKDHCRTDEHPVKIKLVKVDKG